MTINPTQFSLAYNAHRVLPPQRYLYSYVHALPPLFHKQSISYFSSIKAHNFSHISHKDFPTKSIICCVLGIISSMTASLINWNLYLYRFNQMMFKKCFKGIRSTAMFNNFSVYDFINIHPCNFQNLIRRCYSNKFSFVRSPHNKF